MHRTIPENLDPDRSSTAELSFREEPDDEEDDEEEDNEGDEEEDDGDGYSE